MILFIFNLIEENFIINMSPPVGNKSISSKWKDSPKMFDNDYLDYWSRVYPITGISYLLCYFNIIIIN